MPVAIVTFIVFPGGGSRTSVSSPSICLHVWPLSRMKTARPRAVLANSSTVARIRVTSSGRGGGGFPNPSALVAGFASPCAAVSKHARRSEDSAIPAQRVNSDSASAARSACAGLAKSTNEMQGSTEIRRTGRIVSVVLRFGFCRTLRRSTISRLTGAAYVLLHLSPEETCGPGCIRSPRQITTRRAPRNPLLARRRLGHLYSRKQLGEKNSEQEQAVAGSVCQEVVHSSHGNRTSAARGAVCLRAASP